MAELEWEEGSNEASDVWAAEKADVRCTLIGWKSVLSTRTRRQSAAVALSATKISHH